MVIALAGLAGDLLSKHYVIGALLSDPSLPERIDGVRMHHDQATVPPQQILGELHLYRQIAPGVRFTLSTNPGVVFGTPMSWPLVLVATILTVVVVSLFFGVAPARAYWTHTALALIAAGALGNLYDRLLAQVALPGLEPIRHQVRDFIDCSQIGYKWIFNVADVYLVVGVAMLVLHWLTDRRTSARAHPVR
ncbi:MAG: signal peptidase II [Phycisphaerae bacterium]|nr:signal peptidase II [Phycisphaerae bacterium]